MATLRDSFFNLEALIASTHPLDKVRADFVQDSLTNADITLEPMTIVVDCYLGAGDLQYHWPNPSQKVLTNVKKSGLMSSIYKDRNTWRFFREPMATLDALRKNGEPCVHLLCARYQPMDLKTKNCFPLCIIATSLDMPYGEFSKENNEAFKTGVYLDFCGRQNEEWLATRVLTGKRN